MKQGKPIAPLVIDGLCGAEIRALEALGATIGPHGMPSGALGKRYAAFLIADWPSVRERYGLDPKHEVCALLDLDMTTWWLTEPGTYTVVAGASFTDARELARAMQERSDVYEAGRRLGAPL